MPTLLKMSTFDILFIKIHVTDLFFNGIISLDVLEGAGLHGVVVIHKIVLTVHHVVDLKKVSWALFCECL